MHDARQQHRQIGQRFTRAADYARVTPLQRAVAAELAERLRPLPAPGRMLEAGCGGGHLTALLAAGWPGAALDALDIAPRMLEAARRAVPAPERICWICADAAEYTADTPYDWIVSSSALHWLAPLEPVFRHFTALLNPDGLLAFAAMTDGTLAELREARAEAAPDKPAAGRLATAAAIREALVAAGYNLEVFDETTRHERYASAHIFLQTLRRQGVTGGAVSRGARPLNRRELEHLTAVYARRFGEDGGVYATYRIVYALARRRIPAAGQTAAMQHAIDIRHADRTIVVTARGTASLAGFRILIEQLLRPPCTEVDYPILSDLRELDMRALSRTDIRAIVRVVTGRHEEVVPARHALLVSHPLGFGLARMYQLMAAGSDPQDVRVFHDSDQARAWVGGKAGAH